MKTHRPWLLALWCVAGLAACNAVLVLAPWPAAKAVAALFLDIVLPGVLLYRLFFRRAARHTLLDAALIAAGLGYSLLLATTLGLHDVPGPLTRRLSLGAYDALLGLLLAANLRWPYERSLERLPRRAWLLVAALLAITAALRLINLSYSEFQGDEVAVLHKAAAAIQGRDDVLFLHRKGPAEILLALLPYSQGMALNEWGARLPFALANILAVLAIYRLGWRGLSPAAGLWAGLLAALNGFFVAFSRIVQYQSLVLLFGTLGVLLAWCYAQTRERRYIWLSALFLAGGMLAHSDAAFAALPAAWLILRAQVRGRQALAAIVKQVSGPLLVALALLAAFYLPYVTSATFQQTAGYLSLRMGEEPPYNNLSHLLEIGTVYNAVYYLAFVGLIALWAVLRRTAAATPLKWALPVAFVALLVQAAWTGNAWQFQGHDWLGLLFLLLLAAAVWAPEQSLLQRPLLLWLGVPFVLFIFWFQDPRTHVYAFFPGALLLVGEQLAAWQATLGHRRWTVAVAAAPWLGLAAAYLVIALVSHQPEYRRTYPEHRIHAFWVPFGDELPEQGLFGFPYRVGWKAIGQLYAQGVLAGDYDTNEETHITRWYTRAVPTCDSDPRYYIIAANVQDEQKVPRQTIKDKYELVGRVQRAGITTLEIYERRPATLTYREYDAVALGRVFDREQSAPWYDAGQTQPDPLAGMQIELGVRLGEDIELVGYAVNRVGPRPQDAVSVALYWRALRPITTSYTVFAHLEDPGVVWAQQDCGPRCGNAPTDEWEVDEIVIDRHTLWLNDQVPTGAHSLVVGMYDGQTGQRLPVTAADGQAAGDDVLLGSVDVLPE